MMYSQARYQHEDYYDYQGGYESQRGCYNDQYFDPYSYGGCKNWKQPLQEQYQSRRPPPRTHDEYDDPPESYQESSYDHDYEHSRRAQPLGRDTSYDHSREYQTPRYYRDGYGEEYHDQEDYYDEHRRDRRSISHQSYKSQSYPSSHYDYEDDYLPLRGSINSPSYDSYPSQGYSPQAYTRNTPPPKKKSIAEHMYEHWLKPKPRDPNDPYKTIEEHMCEDMKLQVICHACKGPHYRYQCQKYLFCKICKAKFSCECRGKHRREHEVDQGCNAKPQGKYGLSEETWALARRLGINIVPDDDMEEVIGDVKESEQEIPISKELQDQEKGNPDGGYGGEVQGEKNKEELPFGKTLETNCGKILHSSCGNITLGNNCAKSWADMCDEDECDDIGVPICVDNCNVDYVDNGIEEIVAIPRDTTCMIENVEEAFVEPSSGEISVNKHSDFHDDSYIDACVFQDDCMDAYVENVVVDISDEVVNDEESELENVEEKENVEGREKIEKEDRENEKQDILVEEVVEEKGKEDVGKKEETREESARAKIEEKMKDYQVELKEEKKNEEKKKMEENSILLDMDNGQPWEKSMLYVDLKEFLDARHLRAYLEERVDGEKGLVPVQVCLNEESKEASG